MATVPKKRAGGRGQSGGRKKKVRNGEVEIGGIEPEIPASDIQVVLQDIPAEHGEFYLLENGMKGSTEEDREKWLFVPVDSMEDYSAGQKPIVKMINAQIYNRDHKLVFLESVHAPETEAKQLFVCGTAVHYASDENEISIIGDPIPVRDIELTEHPFLTGMTEGENLTVGLCTEYMEIYLTNFHENAKDVLGQYFDKAQLTKVASEFFTAHRGDPETSYEDLCAYMEAREKQSPLFTMENLINHIPFISGHLSDYDAARDEDEPSMLDNACVKRLSLLHPSARFVVLKESGRVRVSAEARARVREEAAKKRTTEFVALSPVVAEQFNSYLIVVRKTISETQRETDHVEPQVIDDGSVPDDEEEASENNGASVRTKSQRKSVVVLEEKVVEIIDDYTVKVADEIFSVGDGVLVNPDVTKLVFKRKDTSEDGDEKEDSDYDEKVYTEKYRKFDKKGNKAKGSRTSHCASLVVARIIEFTNMRMKKKRKSSVADDGGTKMATVRLFYHPENTSLSDEEVSAKDKNLVYISTETAQINLTAFEDRCVVLPKSEIDARKITSDDYMDGGKARFYYEEIFDGKTGKFQKVTTEESFDEVKRAIERIDSNLIWSAKPSISQKPLRTMDLFSGCGGLSEGFRQSGVSESCWAIDIEESATMAHKSNSPHTEVFADDVNVLLDEVMKNPENARLPNPRSGLVDMIIGGPPCQGFSGLNRFQSNASAKEKNKCLIAFLTAVELYKPMYAVMENVRALSVDKTHKPLFTMVLNCFEALGYNVDYEVLQAGNFGVPQSRRRTILFATRNDCVQPTFPTPVHSFGKVPGPYRPLNMRDAISDLVDASTTDQGIGVYASKPLSHYQRTMRKSAGNILRDHVAKPVVKVNQERIDHIPKRRGADWRDLPNISIEERGIVPLEYIKATKYVCDCLGKRRGEGKKCENKERYTLIPWCLPHTADKYKWTGLFGRLHYAEASPTVVTAMEPMGTQGRVIHPLLNRLLTIREVARVQGFPDDYKFYGAMAEKYCQVGNAVPPPLAFHLGRALMCAVAKMEKTLKK